jgi:hypothetical protein
MIANEESCKGAVLQKSFNKEGRKGYGLGIDIATQLVPWLTITTRSCLIVKISLQSNRTKEQ